MLRSKLRPVYFPNTIAKVSNSTVKSNTLLVKYIYIYALWCLCVRACFAHNYFFREGGGTFNISRPRGPWFLNPSMTHTSKIILLRKHMINGSPSPSPNLISSTWNVPYSPHLWVLRRHHPA